MSNAPTLSEEDADTIIHWLTEMYDSALTEDEVERLVKVLKKASGQEV